MDDDKTKAAVIDAVVSDDVGALQVLLEKGAPVNFSEDSAMLCPLHFAALYDSLQVVPLLVASGTDLSAKTDCGDTALDIALRHGYEEMIALLRKYLHSGGGAVPQ